LNSIHLDNLIHNILDEKDFPLVPHLEKIDKDLKYSFDFFINLNADIIFKQIINKHTHKNFDDAINIIAYYKGKINYFDPNISFDLYVRLIPHLNEVSKSKYNKHFYKEYATTILEEDNRDVDDEIIEHIYNSNLNLYIDIARKLNLENAINKIYLKDSQLVFEWLNNHTNKYKELKQLNQPQFIFNNMNGKLNIDDQSLKYFFEICPLDINIYKDIKKSIGLETVWKFTNHKLSSEFYMELIDTLEDIIFILNQDNVKLSSLEAILSTIKSKFPHLYDNFNSLMLMKKDFYNK